jgi:hypothetical protein
MNQLTLIVDKREGPVRHRLLMPNGEQVAGTARVEDDGDDVVVTLRRRHLRVHVMDAHQDADCGCGGL